MSRLGKLHIKTKRVWNAPVLCGRGVTNFNKVEKKYVDALIKQHKTEEYFCKNCLKKFKAIK